MPGDASMTDARFAHYLKTQLRAALARRDLPDAAALVRAIYGVELEVVPLANIVADPSLTAVAASRRIEALVLKSLGRPYSDVPDVDGDKAMAWVRAKKDAAPGFADIKTNHPATLLVLVKAIDLARQAAEWRVNKPKLLPAPVFLLGETGTGKEMLAKAMWATHVARIKELTPDDRRERTFGAINCAGLAEDVVESELFGHARGAFTGAVGDRQGLLMEHSQGVVLLDEIGDAPLDRVQPRLLRFLQDGEVRPVGANKPEYVYPWVIAATNHPESLREELQHRLGLGRALVLPPLSERGDDVEVVFLALVRDHAIAPRTQTVKVTISTAARRAVRTAPWPGNLRELDQVARDIAAQNHGQGEIHVELDDLAEDVVLTYRSNTSVTDQLSDAYADYVAVAPRDEHAGFRAQAVEAFQKSLQAGSILEVALLHRLRPLVASDLCAHWLGEGHAGLLLAFDQRRCRIESTLVAQLDERLGAIDGVPAPPQAVLVLEPETAPKGAIFLLNLIEGWATSDEARQLAQSLAVIQGHLPPAWRSALSTLPSLLPKESKKVQPATKPAATSTDPPREDWETIRSSRESLQAALDRYGTAAGLARACRVDSSAVTKAARGHDIELRRGRPSSAGEKATERDSKSGSRDSTEPDDTPPVEAEAPTP